MGVEILITIRDGPFLLVMSTVLIVGILKIMVHGMRIQEKISVSSYFQAKSPNKKNNICC